VILTTNHRTDGIYLPADDRRHYVAWSERKQIDFGHEYWTTLIAWYQDGGDKHVAAFLDTLDISGFNPKAPPPNTAAFWEIVATCEAPEDAELADANRQSSPATPRRRGRAHRPRERISALTADGIPDCRD